MSVKEAIGDKQGWVELRGKQHWNKGPQSKNDLDPLGTDLGAFSLCKRLILWYKSNKIKTGRGF